MLEIDSCDTVAQFLANIDGLPRSSDRDLLRVVASNLSDWILFPPTAVLLWDGCVRKDTRTDKYVYPPLMKQRVKDLGHSINTLSNGPAIMAYLASGGIRPMRLAVRTMDGIFIICTTDNFQAAGRACHSRL